MDFFLNILQMEKQPNYAIAALLDEDANTKINTIWTELNQKLGIKSAFADPIPHLTFLQATEADVERVHTNLQSFAQEQAPFSITTSGLGIFTGETNVVYIPVVRTPELSDIQTLLSGKLVDAVDDINRHHFRRYWVPHITLVLNGTADDKLTEIIDLLGKRDFSWTITINQLTLLDGDEDQTQLPFKVTLKGDTTS